MNKGIELNQEIRFGSSQQKHDLTIQNIMDYNNLSSSSIYVGQELSLIAPRSHEVSTYTAKSGDTLYLIANQYGTTVTALEECQSVNL